MRRRVRASIMVVVVDVVFISGRDLPSREALHSGFFPEFARIEMQWSGREADWDGHPLPCTHWISCATRRKPPPPSPASPLFYLISDIPKRVHRTARRAVEYGISERRGSERRRGGDALIESPPLHQPSRIYIHPKCQMAMRFSCQLSLSLSPSLFRLLYPRHSTKKGLPQRPMGIFNNKGQCRAWIVHYLTVSPHGELHFILVHNRRGCLFIPPLLLVGSCLSV